MIYNTADFILFISWIFLPPIAIVIIFFLPSDNIDRIKKIGFGFLFAFLFISLLFLLKIDTTQPRFIYYLYTWNWFFNSNFYFTFGLDSFSALFLVLTTYILCLCCLVGFYTIKKFFKLYLYLYFVILWCLIVVFTTYDLLIFYFFFESILIPMFMIIGIWGSRSKKIKAAYLLFFYTILSSIFFLAVIFYIINKYQEPVSLFTFSTLYNINSIHLTFMEEFCLWLALFLSFATKIPMMPFHLWLPEAHVEAPTSGSMLLAGILLKLGVFGIIKFLFTLAPTVSFMMKGFVSLLALFGLMFAAFTAIRQIDLKRIIAYASISHMNLIILGLFTFTHEGFLGSVVQSISHGFVATLLFFLVGILYERYHTRNIYYFGGLSSVMPLFSLFLFFALFCNISFPGTSNFVGEFLLFFSLFNTSWTVLALFTLISIILSGLYSLWLLNRLIFGNVKNIYIIKFIDLSIIEVGLILSLLIPSFIIGLYPNIILLFLYF